jgi:hypothetical protein
MSDTAKTEVRVIEGWAQHADADHGTGYELGGGAGWCDFSECGDPTHGDKPATLVIGDKAMPMSQVEAMLRDAKMIASLVATNAVEHYFALIAARYGITL